MAITNKTTNPESGGEKKGNHISRIYIFYFLFFGFLILLIYLTTNSDHEEKYKEEIEINVDNEEIDNNISDTFTQILTLGGKSSLNRNINEYKKIRINSPIDSATLLITVEFTPEYKEKVKNREYAIRYFLGEKSKEEHGGFYGVIWSGECNNLINWKSAGFYGRVKGTEIEKGYTREIPLTESVLTAEELAKQNGCKTDYKYQNSLGFINSKIGKEIYVGGYISNYSQELKGWEIANIKNIEIKYIGQKEALTLIE